MKLASILSRKPKPIAEDIPYGMGPNPDRHSGASDEELLETPEDQWLPYLDDQKLQAIVASAPDHGALEAANKFLRLYNYGLSSNMMDATRLMIRAWGVTPRQVIRAAQGMFDEELMEQLIQSIKEHGVELGLPMTTR